MSVNLHVVAGGTNGLESSISATTLPAAAEHHEQTRNKTDTADITNFFFLARVTNRGVMQSVIMMQSVMNIITLFTRPVDYPNVFAWSQPVQKIKVGLYMVLVLLKSTDAIRCNTV